MKPFFAVLLILLPIIACNNTQDINYAFETSPQSIAYGDSWVATDGLGRTLPSFEDVGEYRPGKYVGVFYWLWHPYVRLKEGKQTTVQELINENPESPAFECNDYYWGEPENGFYHPSDPWSTRRNLQMLANAGVDFIYLDFTNGDHGCESLGDFMEVALEMYHEEIPVPKVVFFMNENYDKAMNCVLDNFYNIEEYKPLMFMWEGKPLIMACPEKCKTQCEQCRNEEVQEMFTWRYTWAFKENQWNFLDSVPQDYYVINGKAEQISVSKSMGSPLWNAEWQGSGSTSQRTPAYNKYWLSDQTPFGNFFEEQWSRAHEVDPSIVCVTGWNELTAAAWPSTTESPHPFMRMRWNDPNWRCVNKETCLSKDSAGNHIPHGWFFVDEFNMEFNRDIEPMKGGYNDAYYYQLVSHIRKFKGMSKPEKTSSAKTIRIDGNFDEWLEVMPSFKDPKGDCMHRDFKNVNNSERLVNKTGRNDIVLSKITHDSLNVYFYAETAAPISSYNDPLWMLLLIDMDKNSQTGWEGYDYLVNHEVINCNKSTLKFWNSNSWEMLGEVELNLTGTQIEISISKNLLGLKGSPDFYFKWADNPNHLDNIINFFVNGETAPDRRFNYHYCGIRTN